MVDAKGKPLNEVLAEEFNSLHGGTLDTKGKLNDTYKAVHALRKNGTPRSALCLSGGGIRSAAFALGVLHGLAERELLGRFTYLSTVSGGGYVGAWLSAWRTRTADADIEAELKKRSLRGPSIPNNPQDATADYKESLEVGGLRAFSNYLTPRLGVMSADTWTLVALYIRNLLLNWLIYLPGFIGILLIPFAAIACLKWAHDAGPVYQLRLIVVAGILLAIALYVSVRSRLGRGKKWRVGEGLYLVSELLPTYVAAMLLSAYAAAPANQWAFDWKMAGFAGAVLYGVTGILAAPNMPWSNASSWLRRSAEWGGRLVLLWLAWTFSGAIAGMLVGWGGRMIAVKIVSSGGEDGFRLLVIFGIGWVAASMFFAEALYLGLTSYWRKSDPEREWLARSSGWFVAMSVGWAGLSAASLYGEDLSNWINHQIGTAYASWVAGLAGGSIGAIIARLGKSASPVVGTATRPPAKISVGSLLALASVIFLLALSIILASWLRPLISWFGGLGGVGWIVDNILPPLHLDFTREISVTFLGTATAFASAIAISRFVNVNRFSAHALYRNRLARAFLGSARGEEGIKSETRDPFTGFDTADNVRMSELRQNGHLFHVVNMALNVVAGDNKAWQERKAEPFVVTPLHSGNEYVGFAETKQFGSDDKGITLGTSMAISGAAASPNQGYHSSPLIGFIMALFNVRLGWWLGNPRNPEIAKLEGPKVGIGPTISELFGGTTDKNRYVYLSDGGHFENLGLYEMVRRRCHLIVVSDGGCDPDCAFEDLGNAVRKIWIDLGVGIDFRKIDIRKRGFASKNLYCALGIIKYPERDADDPSDVGYVLYIKPGFHDDGREPADVTAYALANVAFPHETTADQFFSESQMESYRSLGAYIIKTILGEKAADDMGAPTESLRPYWANLQNYLSQFDPKPVHKPYRPRFSYS